VLEQQITQQRKELNGLRKHKIELADLKETREIELEEAKAEAERRRAERLAKIAEDRYVRRVKKGEEGAVAARLILRLAADWSTRLALKPNE
jgi:hypothetical protein